MKSRMLLSIVGLLWAAVASHAEEDLFPFAVSYDSPANVTNVSGWLEKPAGKHGFVRVEQGRLATDAGPIRFWATNLCFDACFPSHEQAERVAARMARLGINCVRMHHMDSHSIWGKSPNKTIIDPERLEKLDYLIYQLKLHGIYTNINLHVSRWLDEKEGFPNREGRPNYDKGLDNFEPRMIELQRKYARDLLTHVNPYTKTAYAEEPAVAMVEINNENALFANWGGGDLDDLPDPYATTFRKAWNEWLKKKYGNTEKLRQTWNVGRSELGEEMLAAGKFPAKFSPPWQFERDDQAVAEWSVDNQGPDGQPRLRVVVTRQGRVAWNPQFSYAGLKLVGGEPYTLQFLARSDEPREFGINAMMAHDPWEQFGFNATVKTDRQWQSHRYTFIPNKGDANARISFTGLKPGAYELAAVSLRPGGIVGLEPGQSLEAESVAIVRRSAVNLTKAARQDWIDFLYSTEQDYWLGMYRFIKDELKVRPIVSGTQLSYSPMHIQASLDYIDAHSYWHHPAFPGRPWDSRDWYVQNAALVNTPGGTLSGLAVRRVAGMAYTVSEYNHPAPIQYAAEGFPMIAAFGAFQGWDGIFSFAYSHNTDFEPGKISSFFDIKGDTSRMVHMPACAAMFLRGDVAPAREALSVAVTPEAERATLYKTLSAWEITADNYGLDPRLSLLHAVAMAKEGRPADLPAAPAKDAVQFVSDTKQIYWDVSQKDAGYFIANTPRSKLFTGFIRGRTFKLGDIALRFGKTRLDWATVSLVAVDGEGFDKPGRLLVAATGQVENQGMTIEDLGSGRITVRDKWGAAPMLCEGIEAELLLPVAAERVALYPLDEAGNRREAAPVAAHNGKARIVLAPRHKTVWYEIQVRE